MKKVILKTLIVMAVISFNGCAMYYRPISPNKTNYNILEKHDGIEFSYRYDMLRERGNKKMGKRELNSGIKIVAVRVTNNTDSIHVIGNDIAFYSGLKEIFPLSPVVIKNHVKQSVAGYTPYFIGALFKSTITFNGRVVSNFPFPLIVFPCIAIGNMLVANTANSKLLKELEDYDIMGKEIKPGETIYGIIGVQDGDYSPLTIRKK